MGTTYSADLQAVELESFCRFVNRHWSTPRLTAKQAEGGDDYGAGWQLWSYGNEAGWLKAIHPEATPEVAHDEIAVGWLDARQLFRDRLHVRLHLFDDIDETIPPGEPDDPEPWHERRLGDWILSFAAGWMKHHYGVDLVRVQETDAPAPVPSAAAGDQVTPAPVPSAAAGDQVTPAPDSTIVELPVTESQSAAAGDQVTPAGGSPGAGSDDQVTGGKLGLTAREMQVADLLADGRSHEEISTRLVIAVGTVGVHVQNITRKIKDATGEDGEILPGRKCMLLRSYGYGSTRP